MYCFNYFLLQFLLKLNNSTEPNFQTSHSSLELLLIDSWSESETLVFLTACSSSICFLFFCFRVFWIYFCTIVFTLCLVNLSFLSICLLFCFCFACSTIVLRVVHWSVVCPHVPWYWQNFFPFCPWSESSSSESSKVTTFLVLESFLLFLSFLERTLGGIDFSKFSSLASKNSAIEWIEPSKYLYLYPTIFFFQIFGIA